MRQQRPKGEVVTNFLISHSLSHGVYGVGSTFFYVSEIMGPQIESKKSFKLVMLQVEDPPLFPASTENGQRLL